MVQTYQIYIVDFITHCEGVCVCFVFHFLYIVVSKGNGLLAVLLVSGINKVHLSIFNAMGDNLCVHT